MILVITAVFRISFAVRGSHILEYAPAPSDFAKPEIRLVLTRIG